MFTIERFRAWNLNAGNFTETVQFYRSLLGAEERVSHTVGGVAVVRLGLGGVMLGVFDASGGPRTGVPHHTFGIQGPEDPEELRREIEAKGFAAYGARRHPDGASYSVYLDDPSGNHIELSTGQG